MWNSLNTNNLNKSSRKHQGIATLTDIGLAVNCIIICHRKECRFSGIMGLITVDIRFHLRITIGIIDRWSLTCGL